MTSIVEPLAAAGFQIVDPSEIVGLDEIEVQPEAFDDQIVRRPADWSDRSSRLLSIDSLMCSPPGSWSLHNSSTHWRPARSCAANRFIIAARALRSDQPFRLVIGT